MDFQVPPGPLTPGMLQDPLVEAQRGKATYWKAPRHGEKSSAKLLVWL